MIVLARLHRQPRKISFDVDLSSGFDYKLDIATIAVEQQCGRGPCFAFSSVINPRFTASS